MLTETKGLTRRNDADPGSKEFPERFLACLFTAVILLRFLAIPAGPEVCIVERVEVGGEMVYREVNQNDSVVKD